MSLTADRIAAAKKGYTHAGDVSFCHTMTLGWLDPSIRIWALSKRRDEQQKRIFLGAWAFGR